MRKLFAALAITAASLAIFEGCAPVPLPHYAAYKPRRVEELLVDSENLRQAGDEWERFWLLDQPSHMTPFRTHGGVVPDLRSRSRSYGLRWSLKNAPTVCTYPSGSLS